MMILEVLCLQKISVLAMSHTYWNKFFNFINPFLLNLSATPQTFQTI